MLIAQARQRIGTKPLQSLFELSTPARCAQDRKHYLFKELSLFAMDGTALNMADTPELLEHFGAQVYQSDPSVDDTSGWRFLL